MNEIFLGFSSRLISQDWRFAVNKSAGKCVKEK